VSTSGVDELLAARAPRRGELSEAGITLSAAEVAIMKRICGIVVVAIAAVILVIGLFYSTPLLEAQATRQVEIKRIKLSKGQDNAQIQTLGVAAGISCVELETGVECFVVSTR
jgi:hypothetical protein